MIPPGIGVTLGDPAGIGPEIVVKALTDASLREAGELVLFADPRWLQDEERRLGLPLRAAPWERLASRRSGLFLEPVPASSGPIALGRASQEAGRASFLFFERALAEVSSGRLDGLVTAPISKQAWAMAGLPWRGHTERLAKDHPEAIMAFWSERLKIALYTHHLPLREALEAVRQERLGNFLRRLHKSLARLPGGPFSLIVAGLNPHAGEGGRLGREDEDEVRPAVEAAAQDGVPVSGPFPPDVVFRKALAEPRCLAVALYHDQGLIPFKLEAFSAGVNVTLGLPFVRTSPAHGTAFDIAGRGEADPRSMREALRLAVALSAGAS